MALGRDVDGGLWGLSPLMGCLSPGSGTIFPFQLSWPISLGSSLSPPERVRLSRRCQIAGLCPRTSLLVTLRLVLNRVISCRLESLPGSEYRGPGFAGGQLVGEARLWGPPPGLALPPTPVPDTERLASPCGSFLSRVPALWTGGRRLTAPCQGSRSQGQLSSSRCQRRVGGKKGFPGTELYMTQVFRMINALQHGAHVGARLPRPVAEHVGEGKPCSGAGSAGTARPRGAGEGGALQVPRLACLPC